MEINLKSIENWVSQKEISELAEELRKYNELLENGLGAGNDFLGWVNLPSETDDALLSDIETSAAKLSSISDVVVIVGIGGSYLGARSVMEALHSSFDLLERDRKHPIVLFAGQNLSEDYTAELMDVLSTRDFSVIVISKSGTTTEPGVAFRLLKAELEKRYGKEAAGNRIIAVTDKARGALKTLATSEGYKTFVIEDNVGGRYSVLTPVGLLPLAVSGVDIRKLVAGAVAMQKRTSVSVPAMENPSLLYAAARTALYRKGKKVEILASYEPKLQNIGEWWKQLYGESEGKEGKGIFPASVTLTADLHSMGQYIQQGERTLFETVMKVENAAREVRICSDEQNLDSLNYLAGRRLTEVNHMAALGTRIAHVDGGVPNIEVTISRIDETELGALLYFFERACGISGYALGVNPFDQPGVEAYKKNMFALLGKPGFEKQTEEIRKRCSE